MNRLRLRSSDASLDEDFRWAQRTALGYRRTGAPGEIPCYWAGLLDRECMYIRDLAHQAPAAHLLGMAAENQSMLRAFASTASAARGWYPLWSLGFDGRLFEMDYHHDDDFAREIPMAFEPVEMAWRQYLWSGERVWIDDPVIWSYCTHVIEDFIRLHDRGNGVAGTDGVHGWPYEGIASYNEGGEHLAMAGDAYASQHAAMRAYARMQFARGDVTGAAKTDRAADALRQHYLERWICPATGQYARGIDRDGALKTGWGELNSIYIPSKFLGAPGPRMHAYLDMIQASAAYAHGVGFEMRSYLPEAFFPYGRDAEAWRRLRHMYESRNPYPEISYVALWQTIEGLCGIEPDAPAHRVATLSHLTPALDWIEVEGIQMGGHVITVRHDGASSTTLVHASGPVPLAWQARTACADARMLVDGSLAETSALSMHGRELRTVDISVPVGASVTVARAARGANP